MNSCCALPVEAIAADQHKQGGQCCLVTEKTEAPAKAECPISKTLSRKVQRRTVEHLVKAESVGSIQNVQYYYCTAPDCSVVYFPIENAPPITQSNINAKVFSKDGGEDVNVCYCFEWKRGRIKDEIVRTGKSTASLQIAREVKAGTCACDVKNPKGECCLGDINTVAKQMPSERTFSQNT